MANLRQRVTELERKTGPAAGTLRVVWMDTWARPAEECEAVLTKAEAETGPNDTLIVIEYVHDWRSGDDEREAAFA